MLALGVETGVFWILATGVVLGLIFLHYLLFREYVSLRKKQTQHLKDFENLVNNEINRSQSLSNDHSQHQEIKEKTDEKLEVIKLQVEAMSQVKKPE